MPDGSDSISAQFIGGSSDSGVFAALIAAAAVMAVISFFLSLCIGAIGFASAAMIKKQADAGSVKALKALGILNRDTHYLRKTNAARMISSAISYMLFICGAAAPLTTAFYGIINNKTISFALSAAVCIILYGIFLGCFGIMLPEKAGELRSARVIVKLSGLFIFLNILSSPFTFISGLLSDIAAKLIRRDTDTDADHNTEEDILLMVDEGEENGTIEGNTKDMIENIFDFDDTSVGEIMTHRKDVVAVREDATIKAVTELAIKSGRSRIPVYKDDIDDITGIIHVKDLLKYVSTAPPEGSISPDIIKEAVFVPESKRCSEMFEYMTAHKTQIAVVVDEFGGTGGIITMEDLIESIVGNIQDEYDNEDEEIKQLGEHSFTVDGATPLDEISELTGISFEDDENDTIAGYMLDRLGRIPENGEHPSLVTGNTRFTVLEVSNLRISKVMVVVN